MREKRKYNLKQSVLLLLLLAVFLIVATYAWFTSNQTVTVSSLQVNVEAKNGLQISVDGTNWKSIISSTDIAAAHTNYSSSVNQLPNVLEPVSTIGEVDTSNGFMKMFYGVVSTNTDGDYILSSTQSVEQRGSGEASTGKFIAFDLFFKVDTNTDVYLSPQSYVVDADGSTKGMENAARVAFVYEGNTAAGSAIGAIQGLRAATDSTVYIWEPNYDTHTAAGVSNAYDVYGITTSTSSGLLPYHGVRANITTTDNVRLTDTTLATNSDFFSAVTPRYSTTKGFTTKVPLPTLSLSAGITKIRMYMWVEGQDVDCENNASGSNIRYNLQITSDGT